MADSSIPISVQGYKRLEKELAELKEEHHPGYQGSP